MARLGKPTAAGADRRPMTHAPASEQRTPIEFWLHLGLNAVLLAVLLTGPGWTAGPALGLCLLLGLVAIHRGPYLNRPSDEAPWRYIRYASWVFIVCSVLRLVREAGGLPGRLELLPDLLTVPAYIWVGLCFSVMLRRRRAAEDDTAWVDALLMGLGTAFLTWTLLIAPNLDQELSASQMINALFPVVDVIILVLGARLLLTSGSRQPSLWMMVLAVGALFTGDMFYSLRWALRVDLPEVMVDVFLMLMFALLTGASLHPSMRTLTEPQRVVVRNLSSGRTVMIGVMVVFPVALTSLMPPGTLAGNVVRAVLCVCLILTVLTRVIRSNNSRARAERISRRRVTHDTLTDLPTRELLTETVTGWTARADRDRVEVGLLFVDLDRFKMINDNWGHPVGDELLRAVR